MSKTEFREPRPGETIGGHYVIERELGRGGFGVVFQARHRDIDRVVACKVLLATYADRDPSAVARFRREATIAAQLSYPNAVRVFDYGATDEGTFYLIMEFVQGSGLDRILRAEGAVSPKRAVHVLRQVLYALSEAHDAGIVHRDIKPENVMNAPLRYDPDFIKVMDFGIAKMVGAGESITQAGITLGTPRYMPPEQLQGRDLSPATDIYAVGLLLYEMLTGHAYFAASGDNPVDIAIEVLRGPGVVIGADCPAPPGLGDIIARCCAKDAAERYQSAAEVLAALDAAERRAGGFSEEATPVPREVAQGIDAHRRTLAMPSRGDASGEDALGRLPTMAVDTDRGAPIDGPTGGVDRLAKTQALATDAIATRASEATARSAVAGVTTAVPIQPDAPRGPSERAPGPRRGASPPLLVGLQAATLALVIVALVKLFVG